MTERVHEKVSYGLLFACFALMALIAFSLLGCSGGASSAQEVVERAVKASVEDDIDAYMQCLAPSSVSHAVDSGGYTEEEFKEELRAWNLDDDRGYFTKHCGEDFTANYNALNPSSLDQGDYESVVSDLVGYYDYDEASIQDLAEVTVSVTASGSSGSEKAQIVIACVKVNGAWYVHRPGFDV